MLCIAVSKLSPVFAVLSVSPLPSVCVIVRLVEYCHVRDLQQMQSICELPALVKIETLRQTVIIQKMSQFGENSCLEVSK